MLVSARLTHCFSRISSFPPRSEHVFSLSPHLNLFDACLLLVEQGGKTTVAVSVRRCFWAEQESKSHLRNASFLKESVARICTISSLPTTRCCKQTPLALTPRKCSRKLQNNRVSPISLMSVPELLPRKTSLRSSTLALALF